MMKITFLGTAAATAMPLPFCDCMVCKMSRKLKGKNIRKRSSVAINNDLLIDLGPDSAIACIEYDINLSKIKYILQTHVHSDHFDAGHLVTRHLDYASENIKSITLVSSPDTMKALNRKIQNEDSKIDIFNEECQRELAVSLNIISHKEAIILGDYKISAFESLHDVSEQSLIYLIENKGKTILYGTDLLEISEEVYSLLKGHFIDIMILDQTYGAGYNAGGHLDAEQVIEIINRMKEMNIINENSQIFATHISHEGNSIHEVMEEVASQNFYNVAYDGCIIEI